MPERTDPLCGIRVLDTAGSSGAYCGRLLADLGADVVLVEPTGGLPSRRHEPVVTVAGEDLSCFDRFVNVNKRSLALAPDPLEAAAQIRRLVASADVLIETREGDRLPTHGLADDELRRLNRRLVRVVVSSFGGAGPYSGFAGDDLAALAAGGLLSLGGYADTEPIAVHGEQTYFARSTFAAAGALVALLMRETTGTGETVEVCAQEAIANALEDALPDFDLNGRVRRRRGERPREAGTGTYRCADGYVAIVAGRLGTARAFVALLEWIGQSGSASSADLSSERWLDHEFRQSDEGIDRFGEIFERFAAGRTKAELYREGQRRKIPIAPVNSAAEVLSDPQLRDRGFFVEVADATGAVLTYPGRPYAIDGLGPFLRRRAPRVGEHTAEVLGELADEAVAAGPLP